MLRLMIGPDTARELIRLYRDAGAQLAEPADARGEGETDGVKLKQR